MRPQDNIFDRSQLFDVVIATCGYERRSSYLCRLGILGRSRFSIVYPGTHGGSFDSNKAIYEASEWILDDLEAVLRGAMNATAAIESPVMAIDISSMPRRTLGRIVEWLTMELASDAIIHFLYCPGDFTSSIQAAEREGPLSAAPLSEFYAGQLRPPSIPIGLIIGLGLEPDRALGIIEFLEPARIWLFASRSDDERFAAAAASLHRSLLESNNFDGLFYYDIRSLSETYSAVESLCFSLGLDYRLLLAPSGPKLFSLACLLVGAERSDSRPAVWRVGNRNLMMPVDVVEAGDVCSSLVPFSRSAPPA